MHFGQMKKKSGNISNFRSLDVDFIIPFLDFNKKKPNKNKELLLVFYNLFRISQQNSQNVGNEV